MEVLSILKVVPAPFNPPNRTEKVENLKSSIEAMGQLEPIHVVKFPTGKYVIADGHRRHTSKIQLGHSTIDAIIYDGGETTETAMERLHELYVELNSPKMTLKNTQQVVSHLKGGPSFNKTVASTKIQLSEIFSEEEIRNILVPANVGTYQLSVAKRIVRYCHSGEAQNSDSFNTKVRQTLLWLINLQQQQNAIAYMRHGWSHVKLWNAIKRNRTVPNLTIPI